MAMQILTMVDKAQRDELFDKLRASDDPLERQVTKFSGVRQIMETLSDGSEQPKVITKPNYAGRTTLKPHRNYRFYNVYESTWSVAYPCL
jgi:hypothetical protein